MFWSGPNDAPGDEPWQPWNVLVHSVNMAARQPTSHLEEPGPNSMLESDHGCTSWGAGGTCPPQNYPPNKNTHIFSKLNKCIFRLHIVHILDFYEEMIEMVEQIMFDKYITDSTFHLWSPPLQCKLFY